MRENKPRPRTDQKPQEAEPGMILADTSVIIDFWKYPEGKKQTIFENNEIATCYVTRAELVHGAKSGCTHRFCLY